MLKLADLFFTCFHSIVILFNLLGWMYKPARKWNLLTLILTGASWLALGLFYGIGYCPLTDWHFQVLKRLGQVELPSSYISYLLNRLFGLSMRDNVIDTITLVFFLTALCISVILNIRDFSSGRTAMKFKV